MAGGILWPQRDFLMFYPLKMNECPRLKKKHVKFGTFIFQPSIVRQEMLVFMTTIPEEVALEKGPCCLGDLV